MINGVINSVVLNDTNTELSFHLRTTFLTLVKGRLNNVQGNVFWLDNKTKDNIISISADASTVKTTLPERDLLFKSGDHLNIWKFNKITMLAENFIQHAGTYYSVAKVTIKDITNELILIVKLDRMEKILNCKLSFNRFDFALGQASEHYEEKIFVAFDIKVE